MAPQVVGSDPDGTDSETEAEVKQVAVVSEATLTSKEAQNESGGFVAEVIPCSPHQLKPAPTLCAETLLNSPHHFEESTNLHSNNSEKLPPLEESTNLDSNVPPEQLAPWDGEKAKGPEYMSGTFRGMF